MDTASVVLLGVFVLVVFITLFALLFRMDQLESRLVEAPEQAVRGQPLDVDWLVEGYCVKDRRRVEMINPRPITMGNGRPATAGVCPHCGTRMYKIGKSYGVVEAIARVREDRERIPQGRREVA
jgi:hypothetical protein